MGERYTLGRKLLIALIAGTVVPAAFAQTVNTWEGDAVGGNWSDKYKWKLDHPPAGEEAAHFRNENSVITVNSTVSLDNGMYLYGQELMLKGNGNINLYSPVPHKRTINIPASATGFANLTLADNISLNGRVSLSAKGFGTSASKGTLTLKNRSTVTGDLAIGNQGTGSGQVYVKDKSTLRITGLEINTKAKSGGMAEIHILGGSVSIETKLNPFEIFMEDPGRRIIIGDSGQLRIESDLPIERKKELLKELISNNRLAAAPGCRLETPVVQSDFLIARAKYTSNESEGLNLDSLLSNIDNISDMPTVADPAVEGEAAKVNIILASDLESNSNETMANQPKPHLAGYIVFFGGILLVLRRSPEE